MKKQEKIRKKRSCLVQHLQLCKEKHTKKEDFEGPLFVQNCMINKINSF